MVQFNHETFQKIIQHVSDGVQVVNLWGQLVFCNRQSAILDDINIEESLGRHITELYPSLDETNSTILRVLETGEPILNVDQKYTTYLGNEVHTVNSTIPLFDEKGKLAAAAEISRNITEVKKLSEQVVDLQKVVLGATDHFVADKPLFNFEDIITRDPATLETLSRAMKAAQNDASILITGDTGTGKELLVQAIHNNSPRRDHPFIAQNCAALPESLLEGILFGTLKGGFTGSTNRPGIFEIAGGGTLFLDEINSMPIPLQTKILRVIQDGRFRRIGDTKTREANVRIVAAINKDPLDAIEAGELRRDLYYRLNTITLSLSPLRERQGDVGLLTRHFIKKFNGKYYRNVQGITPEALKVLEDFSWPGNIRELEHVIEGIMSLTESTVIALEDLPRQLLNAPWRQKHFHHLNLRAHVEVLENSLIREALRVSGGNISKAAESLDIPRQTLQYKLKKINADI